MRNTLTAETQRTEFIRLIAAAGTPIRLTANTITDITRANAAGQMCTFTTEFTHGAVAGSVVVLTGGAGEFTGEAVVVATPTATTFVAMIPGTTSPGTVSYACYFRIRFRHAIVIGKNDWRTANNGNVWIGGSSVVNEQPYDIEPYAAGGIGELRLGDPSSDIHENLCDYWLDGANTGDGVIVRYV